MSASARPILGAAMPLAVLPLHRDWLFEKNRDLELQDFCYAETLESDWRPIADAALKLLDGWTGRLGIHGPFWGFTIDSEDPGVRALVAHRLDQGLDVCTALGATQMVVHSPYTTWDYNNLDDQKTGRERLVERVHQTIDRAVARAADQGVTLVLENIQDKDPHARVGLARTFPGDTVKVSIDTGHAHYAHRSTGAPPVDYYVHAAGALLDHVHVQDADGYADRHWHPGEGTILWPSVFAALARSAENPRLIIEVKDQAGLRKGADHLVGLGLAD